MPGGIVAKTLLAAEDECRKAGSYFVGTEHLFLAIASVPTKEVEAKLSEYDLDVKTAVMRVSRLIRRWDPSESWSGLLIQTPRLRRICDNARLLSAPDEPSSHHFLQALMNEHSSHTVRALLDKAKDLSTSDLVPTATPGTHDGLDMELKFEPAKDQVKFPSSARSSASILEQFGKDLTELARQQKLGPCVPRERELGLLIRTLSRQNKPNALLVGEPGTGKTALVEQLSLSIVEKRVPDHLRQARIIEISISSLISGTQYRGDFEQRIEAVLAEATSDPNIILFLDEFHLAIGAGAAGSSNIDAANVLKPALARGTFRCIAATTIREYRKFIEPDDALTRRFQTVMVNPPSAEETLQILKVRRKSLEAHHGVVVQDSVLVACIEMSERYDCDRNQPDKSIDLLDDACSRVAMSSPTGRSLPMTTLQHVAEAVADRTGIPVENLVTSQRERLASLRTNLASVIQGQDAAIDSVVAVLREIRLGLRDENRPNGVLLFTGPTGVGKTLLAEQLAATFYDSKESMIRIDMSEYTEPHSMSRLIGAPPGFVGHDEQGQLTNALRTRPYRLVLLDEVEKAHPQIFDLFLQVFGSGRLTDGRGEAVDCRQAMFVMTSNLGAEAYWNDRHFGLRGPSEDDDNGRTQRDQRVMEEVSRYFRPEFLNRIDRVICFDPISKETMEVILDKMIEELRSKLEARDILVKIPQDVRSYLARQAGIRQGVPALARILRQQITNQAIEQLVNTNLELPLKLVAKLTGDGVALQLSDI